MATLGDDERGLVGSATSVVRDTRGRYFVASESRRDEILVFDVNGRFQNTIGRKGQGPGEYQWAGELVMASGDTLHVIDVALHRWTTLTPDFKVAYTRPLPGSYLWDEVVLENGEVVVNLYVAARDRAAFPLHVVDSVGTILRSFGAADDAIVRRDLASTTFRKVARALNGGVWSSRVNEYKIELWDTEGSKRRQLVRRAPWFRPWVEATPLSPVQPPRTEIKAIHQDRAGLLWLLVQVPDPGWRESLEERNTPEGRQYRPTNDDAVYDTYVDVIDPSSATVLVSQRIPMNLTEFVDDGLAFSSSESGEAVRVSIWRLQIVRPKPGRSQ